jgi:site-specific DNA-methyltransferase (adenine-specific)
MTWQVINGSSAEILKTYPDNSFDCVVTDPPYGINFLGKAWDNNTGDREVYEQCLRVLKPGGHLLAFSAARTYHHLAMTVETVGFEIRDQIMWIYGSGFPKSQDVGRQIQKSLGVKETISNPNHRTKDGDSLYESGHQKTEIKGDVVCTDTLAQQWSGWGTQLKPAHEPIVMARKPVIGSIRLNVLEHGTGAINIDATRVGTGIDDHIVGGSNGFNRMVFGETEPNKYDGNLYTPSELGRFPANVIHDGSDEVVSMFPNSNGSGGSTPNTKVTGYGKLGGGSSTYTPDDRTIHNSGSGSAARFFYCPKVSQKERNIGCDTIEPKQQEAANFRPNHKEKADAGESGSPYGRFNPVSNNHPTVKPIELMKYLIKLVTPPNGHILDPFNGSGSTGCAAVELGFDYTGIELDPNYVEIANKRISHWESECKPKTTYNNLFEEY